MKEPNKFELSIIASGMTRQDAQNKLDFKSYQAIMDRLDNPGVFRLRELKTLYDSMTEQGASMLKEAVDEYFFCSKT